MWVFSNNSRDSSSCVMASSAIMMGLLASAATWDVGEESWGSLHIVVGVLFLVTALSATTSSLFWSDNVWVGSCSASSSSTVRLCPGVASLADRACSSTKTLGAVAAAAPPIPMMARVGVLLLSLAGLQVISSANDDPSSLLNAGFTGSPGVSHRVFIYGALLCAVVTVCALVLGFRDMALAIMNTRKRCIIGEGFVQTKEFGSQTEMTANDITTLETEVVGHQPKQEAEVKPSWGRLAAMAQSVRLPGRKSTGQEKHGSGGFTLDGNMMDQIANFQPQPPPIVPAGPMDLRTAQQNYYGKKAVGDLKAILSSRMLPEHGMKAELVARLIRSDRSLGFITTNDGGG